MNIYVDAPQWAVMTFNTILCSWCIFNAYLNFQKLQLMKLAAIEPEGSDPSLG